MGILVLKCHSVCPNISISSGVSSGKCRIWCASFKYRWVIPGCVLFGFEISCWTLCEAEPSLSNGRAGLGPWVAASAVPDSRVWDVGIAS